MLSVVTEYVNMFYILYILSCKIPVLCLITDFWLLLTSATSTKSGVCHHLTISFKRHKIKHTYSRPYCSILWDRELSDHMATDHSVLCLLWAENSGFQSPLSAFQALTGLERGHMQMAPPLSWEAEPAAKQPAWWILIYCLDPSRD